MTAATRGPIVALLLAALAAACTPVAPEHPAAVTEHGVVRIPTSLVTSDEVVFRTFKHENKNVNFLVRRDGDGAIHVHLDACYSCWRYRRGFVLEDLALVCIACRLAYRLEDASWDFIGACAPIPIAFSLVDDEVVIQRTILERAARYF